MGCEKKSSHNDNIHFSFIWQPVYLIKQGRIKSAKMQTHFSSIWAQNVFLSSLLCLFLVEVLCVLFNYWTLNVLTQFLVATQLTRWVKLSLFFPIQFLFLSFRATQNYWRFLFVSLSPLFITFIAFKSQCSLDDLCRVLNSEIWFFFCLFTRRSIAISSKYVCVLFSVSVNNSKFGEQTKI